jgi:ribosomal protein L37AE/L43A
MPNPQLDQFTQDLFWKAAPWILLASFIGTFGGLFVKWLERRATEFGRRRAARARGKTESVENSRSGNAVPHCPECNALMVKRQARKGPKIGQAFWGCGRYPDCRGTRDG